MSELQQVLVVMPRGTEVTTPVRLQYGRDGSAIGTRTDSYTSLTLVGVALANTANPVLARILLDLGLLKTPLGGTYGSSHRMLDRFAKAVKLTQTSDPPFDRYAALDGRIRFAIHTNEEKKILHTVLVERNGLLEAMTIGTQLESKWGGEFWGARAYSDLIQPASTTRPASNELIVSPLRKHDLKAL